jgi:hypothetical protein
MDKFVCRSPLVGAAIFFQNKSNHKFVKINTALKGHQRAVWGIPKTGALPAALQEAKRLAKISQRTHAESFTN